MHRAPDKDGEHEVDREGGSADNTHDKARLLHPLHRVDRTTEYRADNGCDLDHCVHYEGRLYEKLLVRSLLKLGHQ